LRLAAFLVQNPAWGRLRPRLIACGYLSSAGRYTEAADIYQDYDRIAAEWGLKPNLDVIKDYLFSKFMVNYEAGRKDSALAVAVKIASLIDSAVVQQKDNAAAELATIYETQKKEAQIARQQTELSHQRMVGLIIAFVALIIFFVIIDLYRRRSAKRLAKVNAAKERIESELRIARDIQMSMVPHLTTTSPCSPSGAYKFNSSHLALQVEQSRNQCA